MHSNADGPAGSRADATGEVAPSLKWIRGPSGPTGIYILLYDISSDTHVWSYVFMGGTSVKYRGAHIIRNTFWDTFWVYLLEIQFGHTFWYTNMLTHFPADYQARRYAWEGQHNESLTLRQANM